MSLPLSPEDPDVAEPRPPAMSHAALFLRFLRFGALAFGGPVAQIGMLRHELIEREGWMSSARFNRLLAVMQALPGPEAHELCVHLGMRAKGRIGGVLAGLGFMLPGLILMLALSWFYFRIDLERPWIAGALLAVQAAVIGLILISAAIACRWKSPVATPAIIAAAGGSAWSCSGREHRSGERGGHRRVVRSRTG